MKLSVKRVVEVGWALVQEFFQSHVNDGLI